MTLYESSQKTYLMLMKYNSGSLKSIKMTSEMTALRD